MLWVKFKVVTAFINFSFLAASENEQKKLLTVKFLLNVYLKDNKFNGKSSSYLKRIISTKICLQAF